MTSDPVAAPRALAWERRVAFAISAALCLLFAAACIHALDADVDPTIDSSRGLLTDEGWKSANAMNKVLTGEWLCSDRNHILLMPVMPLVQYAVFALFGLSLKTARAPAAVLALVVVVLCALFTIRGRGDDRRALWTLPVFVALIGTNYVFVSFARTAFVDIPMYVGGLLAMLGLCATPNGTTSHPWRRALGVGLALALSILTKTSGVLFIGVLLISAAFLYLLDRELPLQELKRIAIAVSVAVGVVVSVQVVTNLALVGSFERAPVQNVTRRASIEWTSLVRHHWLYLTRPFFADQALLFWLSLIGALGTITDAVRDRTMAATDRMMLAFYLSCWLFFGYFFYQPARYLVITALPMAYFAARVPTYVAPALVRSRWARTLAVVAAGSLLSYSNGWNVQHMARYPTQLKYTMRDAARDIKKRVTADARRLHVAHPVLTGEFASTFALANAMPFSFDLRAGTRPLYVIEHQQKPVRESGVKMLRKYRVLKQYEKRDVFLYRWDTAKAPPEPNPTPDE